MLICQLFDIVHAYCCFVNILFSPAGTFAPQNAASAKIPQKKEDFCLSFKFPYFPNFFMKFS